MGGLGMLPPYKTHQVDLQILFFRALLLCALLVLIQY